ncbi:MAG: multi-sensor hybrid histidine kinase [Capsulimonas sp.]|nr:multi-sensor hybrid histidine kinase [Capsulimonas sp.]
MSNEPDEITQYSHVGADASSDSAAALRFAADALPVLIAYVDSTMRYRFNNRAYTTWIGRPHHELTGRHMLEVLGPQVFEAVKPNIEEALAGASSTYERELTWPDGQTRFTRGSYVPNVAPDGQVLGFAILALDLTDHRRTEAHLAESQQRFKSLFDYHPDAIYSLDLTGRFLSANTACENLTGYDADELMERSCTSLIATEDLERTLAHFHTATEGQAQHYETVIIHKLGVRVAIYVTNVPLVVNGVVIGVYGIAEDISDRKATEQALKQSETRKAAILDVAIDCIITMDAEGTILEFNPAAEQTFGYLREDVLGRSMPELIVVPTRDGESEKDFQSSLVAGSGGIVGRRLEMTGLRRGGAEFPIEIAIIPVAVQGETIFTAYLRDISRSKFAEAAENRLRREIEAGELRQRAFLREILASVTEGKLRLLDSLDELPERLPRMLETVPLVASSDMRLLRNAAKSAALEIEFSDLRWQNLITAVSEAAMNAIVHAGGGVGKVFGDTADKVQVWIEDEGAGILMENLPKATLERGWTTAGSLGHGFWLMLQTVDRMYLLTGPTGTTIVLEQDRIPPPPAWAMDAM